MVSLSCNLLDAFANSLALLFVNDIDERCFELLQSLGWVDSFESDKSKSGRLDAAGKARRRPGCCARLCAARETAQEVCGASVYVFFTMFSPLGWLLATLVSALQLLVILNFVILNSKVTPLMAPLVTLFEGNTVGRLNRDGNVTETAPFTWENVTTAYIALFSSSAGSNAVCRAVQAKGGVGTLALAETYGSTDYDDGLDIFSQLLAASGTYSNFSAAEVLGGVVEKVEETGSGEDASFSLAKLGDAADELFARWDEIPFWGHRSLYGTLLVVLIVAFVNTAPEAVKALKLLRRCHFVAALVHASFFILAMCFSFLVAFSSCDPLDSFRDALALMFILDVDERVYAITPRWLTKAGTGKSRGGRRTVGADRDWYEGSVYRWLARAHEYEPSRVGWLAPLCTYILQMGLVMVLFLHILGKEREGGSEFGYGGDGRGFYDTSDGYFLPSFYYLRNVTTALTTGSTANMTVAVDALVAAGCGVMQVSGAADDATVSMVERNEAWGLPVEGLGVLSAIILVGLVVLVNVSRDLVLARVCFGRLLTVLLTCGRRRFGTSPRPGKEEAVAIKWQLLAQLALAFVHLSVGLMSLLFSFYILIVFPFCQSNIFEAFFDALVLAFIDDLQKVSFAVLKAFAVEPRPLARPPPALWGSSRKLKTNELPSGAPSSPCACRWCARR